MPAKVIYDYLPLRLCLEPVTGVLHTRHGGQVEVAIPSFLYQQLGAGARRLHPWGLIYFQHPEEVAGVTEMEPGEGIPMDLPD